MFDSLKKRLKQAVDKVAAIVSGEKEPKPEKTQPFVPVEQGRDTAAHQPVGIAEPPQTEKPGQELRTRITEETKTHEPVTEPVVIPEGKKEIPLKADIKVPVQSTIHGKEKPLDEVQTFPPLKQAVPAVAEPQPMASEPILKEGRGLFGGIVRQITEKKLDERTVIPILDELHEALLENDVALEVADRIREDVKASLIGTSASRTKIEPAIREALRRAMLGVMTQQAIDLDTLISSKEGPFVILFIGFNGVGKTTTIAKFAHRFKHFGPVIAAGDTFRSASIEQLGEHASRIGVELIKHRYGADSAAVIFDATKHAKATGSRLVLGDTAGRSHSNVNLMDELKKVCRVNKPDLTVLVLDSLTGNDIFSQAQRFNAAVGVDAVVLTKSDVYEKGGATLSAAFTLRKPVLFLGTGQGYDDLKEFDPEEIADALLS